MRKITFLLLILLSFEGNSQIIKDAAINSTMSENFKASAQYTVIDDQVLNMKEHYYMLADLSKKLTAPYSSDEEKLRSIFRWITDNISYDCKNFHNRVPFDEPEGYNGYQGYFYAEAENTIRTKKGMCGEYANLVYQLCKLSGLPCYIVYGSVGGPKWVGFNRKLRMFGTDHAWNKVMLNGKWYQLDATWASGQVNALVTRYKKQFNERYYLTPDEISFPTHAEEIGESIDLNNCFGNAGYPNPTGRKNHPFINLIYCR